MFVKTIIAIIKNIFNRLTFNIDIYVKTAPYPQDAINIFKGEWSSNFLEIHQIKPVGEAIEGEARGGVRYPHVFPLKLFIYFGGSYHEKSRGLCGKL